MKTYTLLFPFLLCLLVSKTSAQFAFKRDIKHPEYSVFFNDIIVSDAGNSIVVTNEPSLYTSPNIILTKLNYRGSVVWSKVFSLPAYYIRGAKLAATENNGFIGFASIDKNILSPASLVFKADSNGNIEWAKHLLPTLKRYAVTPWGIAYTKDRRIYIVSKIASRGIYVQKLDRNGSSLWNKYLFTDSTTEEVSNFAFAIAGSDNGLIISTTSGGLTQRFYNHIYKFSANGVPEWEYTTNQASDSYIYAQNAFSSNNGSLNILYSRYGYYNYSVLNPQTGESETYNIGQTIFDIQSYLRDNSIHSFEGLTFPYLGSSVYTFIKGFSFIEGSGYKPNFTQYNARVERFDSLGRMCPDFQIPVSKSVKEKINFKYTRSSFHLSKPPVDVIISDTVITSKPYSGITNICAGKPPEPLQSVLSNELINKAGSDLQVFPNPVKDQLDLLVNTTSANNSKIIITDLQGNVFKTSFTPLTKGKNKISIDLSNVPAGMYTVRLITSNNVATKKIIKQ